MKKLAFAITILFFTTVSLVKAQKDIIPDSLIVDYLKKNKFNLEFYELSFCQNEILFILEQDTGYYSIWEKRIQTEIKDSLDANAFYIHSKGLNFFKEILVTSELHNVYPFAFKFILESLNFNITLKKVNDFSEVFKSYIKYPEQVDDICLILLVCDFNCDFFKEIQSDKIANWKFNNWLEYGFEEFRIYPEKTIKGKREITERLISYILTNYKCMNQPLKQQSIEMIKRVSAKYYWGG